MIVAGLVWPLLALGDPALPDSYTFRIKSRMLTVWEQFLPSQTEVVNPYYRPLYGVMQQAVDWLAGGSDVGLRALALFAHGFAAFALVKLGKVLRLSSPACMAATFLFLAAPGNVFTALWPVVAYWTLAAGMVFLAIRHWILFQETGAKVHAIGTLGWAGLSLFSSQTAYQLLALGPLLALFPPLHLPSQGRVKRTLLLWMILAVAAFTHFRLLEQSAQGLAGAGLANQLERVLQFSVKYWSGMAGHDPMVPVGIAPWIVLLAAVPFLGKLGRREVFLIAFGFTAPLPFAVLGHSERYAYFASGPLVLAMASLWIEPRASTAPSRRIAPVMGVVGVVVVAALGVMYSIQSTLRFGDVREAARESGATVDSLSQLLPELHDLDRVAFLNAPPMMKWTLNDLLEVDSLDDFVAPKSPPYFVTDHAYFHLGPVDLREHGFDQVLEYLPTGKLERRDPARPFGERQVIAPVWFLARNFRVLSRPANLGGGFRGQLQWMDTVLDAARATKDPREMVVVEQPIPELERPLATESAVFRFESGPSAAAGGTSEGVVIPGQLVVDLDLPRAGLLVVVTYFNAPDPVHRMAGDVGRFCRHVHAELDGQVVPVIPVFYHLSGIVVPAGEHRVVVRQGR